MQKMRAAQPVLNQALPPQFLCSLCPAGPAAAGWLAVTPTAWKHLLSFHSHRFCRTLESQMKRAFIPPRRTHASPMVFFIVSVGEKEILLGVRSAFTLTCEIVIAISKNVSS